MGIAEIIGDKRDDILRLAAQHKAYNVRVFGSVARGEARPDSDVDFVVNFQSDARLGNMLELWDSLKELLGREIDIVEEVALKGRFLVNVKRDAIAL
ncbi:MAG: nucleotidyltransferase domain-containing protein [Anaerolineae bacterium]|nr:nucleotidyltransferase domain-containing protein [Anaerolineae bacterium]